MKSKTINKLTRLLLILTFCYLFSCLSTSAQTTIPAGNVYGTWMLAGSPYNVTGHITVPVDSTLTIQPGVNIVFQGHYQFKVHGRVLAIGTASDSIVFTAADTATGWGGMRYNNISATQDSSLFVFCRLQWGNADSSSSDNGGAFNIHYFSNIRISNCRIDNNRTIAGGGGISCVASSPIINGNIITNNTANTGGGGIYFSQSSPTITNNIICNNSAFSGGGIYCNQGAHTNIYSCTISNNLSVGWSFGGGGGLYCNNGSSPFMKNTILWGNFCTIGNGANVYLYDAVSKPSFEYCDIQGGTADFYPPSNPYTGTYANNIDTDPLFVSPSGGAGTGFNGLTADWSLQSSSPCIDEGTPDVTGLNLPSTDIAGNPRITICRIDIGAYEYQTGIPLAVSLNVTQPILCHGDSNGEITATVTSGIGPYTYHWSNGPTTNMVTGLVAGVYRVTVTDAGLGCSIIESITLTDPTALIVNAGVNKTIICGDTTQLGYVTTNYTGTGTLTYAWLPTTGLSNATIPNPTTTADITYTVTVTSPEGCTASDNVSVNLMPMNSIEICMVGVDSTNNKNLVLWDKPVSLAIDSFYIYRETNVTGVYEKIAGVPYDSMSAYSDPSSNPNVQSNKYKISIKDSCGLETAKSDYHKTMHLAINQGMGNTWNLIWDPYEGFTVSTYEIYRGSSADSMQLIGSTSGGNTQYSDLLAPAGCIYYRIVVVSPDPCNPSKSYYNSFSNIASNNPHAVNEAGDNYISFSVFPNPASDEITVETLQISNIEILNIEGRLLKAFAAKSNKTTINISGLAQGMYFIRVKNSEGIAIKKFVKE